MQKILDNSKIKKKTSKIWVDRSSQFSNSQFKKFLKDNNIEIYRTYNEGKSVVAEEFINNLEQRICKYMAAVSRNVYIDVLDDIINKYNKAFHSIVGLKKFL